VCGWRVGEYLDPGLPMPRIDVVYYVRLRAGGSGGGAEGDRVKIGTTFNPRQRFGALTYDDVLAFELGDRAVEQRRHAQFADARLGTSEWFALTPPLREHILALADGRDPWHVHARWLAEALIRRG